MVIDVAAHRASTHPTTTDVDASPHVCEEPSPPVPASPPRRRARIAAGSRAPTQVNLRRRPVTEGLDAVVSGLLGRAATVRLQRLQRPALPSAVPVKPPVTAPTGAPARATRAPAAMRRVWFSLAFVVGGALATALALALS